VKRYTAQENSSLILIPVVAIVYGIIRIGRAPQMRKHLNFILNLKINSSDYSKVII
jgi:hypothetical protein